MTKTVFNQTPKQHLQACGEISTISQLEERELVDIPEAQLLLSLGRTKFYELLGTGAIEAVKLGRSTKIKLRSIRNYIDQLPAYKPKSSALVDSNRPTTVTEVK
jgi:hypothetical protein